MNGKRLRASFGLKGSQSELWGWRPWLDGKARFGSGSL